MFSSHYETIENEVDESIFDLLTSFIDMFAYFLLHGFVMVILLNITFIIAFKCSLYCVKLLWNTLLTLLRMKVSSEPSKQDPATVSAEIKKVILEISEFNQLNDWYLPNWILFSVNIMRTSLMPWSKKFGVS